MCSYGVGNVGTYNSSFTGVDINEQAFNNPAGRYNYSELVAQAMNQTYVISELFDNSGVPQSLFFTFLPNDTMPNTSFLFTPTPTETTNPGGTGGAESSVFSCSLVAVLTYSVLAVLL